MKEKAPMIFERRKPERGRAIKVPANGAGIGDLHTFLFDQLGPKTDPRIMVVDGLSLSHEGQPQPAERPNRFMEMYREIERVLKTRALKCVGVDVQEEVGDDGSDFRGSLYYGIGKEVAGDSKQQKAYYLAQRQLRATPNIVWLASHPCYDSEPGQCARLVRYLCDKAIAHGGLLVREHFPDQDGVIDNHKHELPYNRGQWANRRIAFGNTEFDVFRKPQKRKKLRPNYTVDDIRAMASDKKLLSALVQAVVKDRAAMAQISEQLLKTPEFLQSMAEALKAQENEDPTTV